jgi:hypothetical protein
MPFKRALRGGVVVIPATAHDDVDGDLQPTCPGSGTFFTWGTYKFTCTATDAAGNSNSATTVVTVRPVP